MGSAINAGDSGYRQHNGMFLFDNTAPNPLPNPGVSFNIATIEFKASGSGSSSISVAETSPNRFAGAGAQITGIAFNSAAITVPGAISGTPEPGSITLVLIGVGACGWICRRRIAS
jgi:PEP-CTERM motif